MTAEPKPYPEMKDSGVPWLGQVPAHWTLSPFMAIARRRAIRNRHDLPLLTVAREHGVFVRDRSNREENHNFIPEDLSNYKLALAGDLVINKMKAWQGSMGISSTDGIVSPAYFVFDLQLENLDFAARLFRSKAYVHAFARISDGVRTGQWDLNMAALRRVQVLRPPHSEQAAIVSYLDQATSEIDQAIASKQRLIDLLTEQKQSIISEAVTRGLDPTVEMKDSGVPWLNEIPESWKILRAKVIFQVINERSMSGTEDLLTVSAQRGITPREDQSVTMFKAQSYAGHKLCSPGDLVINSLWAWAGGLGVSDLRGIVSTAYGVYRPRAAYAGYARYLHQLLRSAAYRWELKVRSKGVWISRLQLSDESFLSMPVLMPPIDEQAKIVSYLDQATSGIDEVIDLNQREIDLLGEYRTRLISDVVTGKVDVRGAAHASEAGVS